MSTIVEELPELDKEMIYRYPKHINIRCDQVLLGRDNGSQAGNKKYYIYCPVCAKDKKLYLNGVFKVSSRELQNGNVCACSGRVRPVPKWHVEEKVRRECLERNYNFIGFVGEYKNTSTYLKLSCFCGYSWNTTSVSKFLEQKRGCPSCAGTIPWSTERFLREAKEVHGNLYDYSLVTNVKNADTKVSVICKDHGVFPADAHHHISRGQGCPNLDCVGKKISESKAHTTEDFIRKAKLVHGDSYDYSNTVYTRSFNPLYIVCPTCGKEFKQAPTDHLSGCGCPFCAGRNQKQSYIFIISENNYPIAFKFGICNLYTARISRQRKCSKFDVSVFGVWYYDTTASCKEAEKEVSLLSSNLLIKDEYFDGYTETRGIEEMERAISIYEKHGGRKIV